MADIPSAAAEIEIADHMLRQSDKHTMNWVPEDGKKNKRKITT